MSESYIENQVLLLRDRLKMKIKMDTNLYYLDENGKLMGYHIHYKDNEGNLFTKTMSTPEYDFGSIKEDYYIRKIINGEDVYFMKKKKI